MIGGGAETVLALDYWKLPPLGGQLSLRESPTLIPRGTATA